MSDFCGCLAFGRCQTMTEAKAGKEAACTVLISLQKLHIICWEEANSAMALAPPPAFIHHLNVRDCVIRIKRNLIISICKNFHEKTVTTQREPQRESWFTFFLPPSPRQKTEQVL